MDKVHPELKEQYERYRFMAIVMCLSGVLPLATLLLLYFVGPGIGYLGEHMLFVLVAFIIQVPLCVVLGYLMGAKRMKFLERSTDLVRKGVSKTVSIIGAYKSGDEKSYITCCVDVVDERDNDVIRLYVMPTESSSEFIKTLPDVPELPDSKSGPTAKGKDSLRSVQAFNDPETEQTVALDIDGTTLWISPPMKLI